MPKFTFFRQARNDGGIRTGIDLEGTTCWERFDQGHGEDDPALLWFVDLRGKGDQVPPDCDALRSWLLDNAAIIREGFGKFADEFQIGFDHDFWPGQWAVPNAPPGVDLKIVVSAIRRLDARELSRVLSELAENWDELVESLQPVVPAT